MIEVADQDRLVFDLFQVRQLITSDVPLTIESRFAPGQRVRIKSGPMLGVEGIVHERRAVTRLIVEIQFLQQGVSLEIEDFYLEAV